MFSVLDIYSRRADVMDSPIQPAKNIPTKRHSSDLRDRSRKFISELNNLRLPGAPLFNASNVHNGTKSLLATPLTVRINC